MNSDVNAPAPATSTLQSNSGVLTSRSILTKLLSTLGSLRPIGPSANEFQNIASTHPDLAHPHMRFNSGRLYQLSPEETAKARSVFLTLHVLFPHHLLPALDLLDHGLVTRLVPKPGRIQVDGDDDRARLTTDPTGACGASPTNPAWEVFYIQSSSAVTSTTNTRRKKQSVSATFYEVRLDSWNCSCPAFSVDAFQGLMSAGDDTAGERPDQLDNFLSGIHEAEEVGWRVGGIATLPSPGGAPICKHILAAVLARAAPMLFGTGVAESIASREQLAGWGGGWGEFGYG
ncbi:uncharacterized protein A1O9_12667 [Exophiala aquamarina CBS 119918]|uniref:SWIM-type domain-containing protein n=1 Tax=Exophiala aquamarina CBS 119918 TaxID=1182545 RepID=A0A072NVB3_9EURO|nr:uncharacterized protein A1O9_12667 [Exophiala aquamarina CBS 119918]KEF51317.1 hypothetical protein A1O9_12667 [Exophiala aquamarina CBS 119918]